MSKKGISIIICCFNSVSRLPKTLEYLARQTVCKDIPVELLLVNNASTDRTKEVALEEWNQYHNDFLFRMVDEDKQGHMFARIKGFQESQYEYVLFCDDDNWLQSDYLQKALDLMESNARIGALGGQSVAISDIDFPEWFPDFEDGYAVGKQSNSSGDVSNRGFLWGAGMIVRRFLLDKIFDNKYPMLIEGRTGSKLISGDDSEICKRILLLGYTLHYDSSLLFYHYIAPNRLTWAYKKRLYEGFDISWEILRKYDFVHNEIKKNMLNKMKGIMFSVLKMLFKSGNSKKRLKTVLLVRAGVILQNAKISNDLGYKNILSFAFDNKSKQ